MSAAHLVPWSSRADIIDQDNGARVPDPEHPQRNASRRSAGASHALLMSDMIGLSGDHRNAITVNPLTKLGLTGNAVQRDLNLLERGVGEVARCLDKDNLQGIPDALFLWDNPKDESRRTPARGYAIAFMLMIYAARLRRRIVASQWLSGISDA